MVRVDDVDAFTLGLLNSDLLRIFEFPAVLSLLTMVLVCVVFFFRFGFEGGGEMTQSSFSLTSSDVVEEVPK